MGNFFTRPIERLIDQGLILVDGKIVTHHVRNGGCGSAFSTALMSCHPDHRPAAADNKACVKATAALRRCFAGNSGMFKHQYLQRLDNGLDQDLKPSPEVANKSGEWRWWTGMRRG